jgi:hypothetical protein
MLNRLKETRGSLAAEMAIVAGACVVVMIIMSNVCLFLIRAGQFDRISAEVARSCAYNDAPSAQSGIEQAMGLTDGSMFVVTGSQSGGGLCGTKTVSFQMTFRPLIPDISIGPLAIHTPTFQRTKTYAVPSIGYESSR